MVLGRRLERREDRLRRDETDRLAIEANLRSLGLDRLDVVNLRMGDLGRTETPLAAPLETLLALREEGLIRHLGISNVSAAEFAEARSLAPIACLQNAYNLARRDDDLLIDADTPSTR